MDDDRQTWVSAATAGALRAHIARNLARFERRSLADAALKPAAVVVMLTELAGRHASLVLTRRVRTLRSHSGQWALPGGRIDPGETAEETALRELCEELGAVVEPRAILGLLDDYPTRSGYVITPVVIWAELTVPFTLNPLEVASVHDIALVELDHPDTAQFVAIPESDRLVIRLRLGDSQIHAPTAAMLYQFREVALNGRATRVADLEQPVWAWK